MTHSQKEKVQFSGGVYKNIKGNVIQMWEVYTHLYRMFSKKDWFLLKCIRKRRFPGFKTPSIDWIEFILRGHGCPNLIFLFSFFKFRFESACCVDMYDACWIFPVLCGPAVLLAVSHIFPCLSARHCARQRHCWGQSAGSFRPGHALSAPLYALTGLVAVCMCAHVGFHVLYRSLCCSVVFSCFPARWFVLQLLWALSNLKGQKCSDGVHAALLAPPVENTPEKSPNPAYSPVTFSTPLEWVFA